MQKTDLCIQNTLSENTGSNIYKQTDLQLIRSHVWPYRVSQETERSVIHYSADVLLSTREKQESRRAKNNIYLIHSAQELQQTIYADFRLNCVYHLAGGDGIHSTQDVDKLYDAGFRSIQPVREFSNHIAQSHRFSTGGLSDVGKDLLPYMQHKGIIVDVAGMNTQSMIDVYKYTKKPILHSHTNMGSLCGYSMNVTDEFLDLIDQSNGLLGISRESIGITGSREEIATIDAYIAHIRYAKEHIGDDNICFSSGFFSLFPTTYVENKSSLEDITWISEQIINHFGYKFAEKFFRGNTYRFLMQGL